MNLTLPELERGNTVIRFKKEGEEKNRIVSCTNEKKKKKEFDNLSIKEARNHFFPQLYHYQLPYKTIFFALVCGLVRLCVCRISFAIKFFGRICFID